MIRNTTLKQYLNQFGCALAIMAFLCLLVPGYGLIIGTPIYLINLIFVLIRYKQFDSLDRRLIIWLPLTPISLWLLLILLGILN